MRRRLDWLGRAAREDRVLDRHSYGRADGEGGTVRLSLWSQPYKESHHPRYTPLVKVPDVEIRNAGRKRFADSRGDASWLEPDKDSSAESLQSDAL